MPFIGSDININFPNRQFSSIKRFRTTRAPTTADFRNFNLMDEWLHVMEDQTMNTAFKLVSKANGVATWVNLTGTETVDITQVIVDAGTSPVVPDSSGNITLTGSTEGLRTVGSTNTISLTNQRDLSDFVVNSDGGEHDTIQKGINAAVSATASSSNPKVVFVTTGATGTYAESITLADGVHVIGTTPDGSFAGITISGAGANPTVRMPATGTFSIKGFNIEAQAGQDCFTQASTVTGNVIGEIQRCHFDAITNVGAMGLNISNGATGFTVNFASSTCLFEGTTVDAAFGQGVTASLINGPAFSGSAKSLEITSSANVTIRDFEITRWMSCDASTLTLFDGPMNMAADPPAAALIATGASSVKMTNGLMTVANVPAISIGAAATVTQLFSEVNNTGGHTDYVVGTGTYVKGSVLLPGAVIGIDGALTVTTILQV